MPFSYARTIRFPDTDAAGVVFFAHTLRICHEAYEESLATAGIELAAFFSAAAIIVPITKSEADYLRPLRCGDRVRVELRTERLGEDRFAIHYEIYRGGTPEKLAVRARTEHVSVATARQQRTPLPAELVRWLETHLAAPQ